MDFFKSVFADDPDPPKPQCQSQSESDSPKSKDSTPDSSPKQSDPNPNPTGWSFGSLIKTIATRSESVIEIYSRDLKEFGSGLKKEIEVAQGSLGNVGHAIDEFGNTVLKGTAQIINQSKDAILAADNESDSSSPESNRRSFSSQRGLNSKRYSRFDAQVRTIQGDVNTYCEEPEDLEDYKKWKSGFGLEEKKEEIERLLKENGEMGSVYKRVVGVPNGVDHETYWCRYFYRVFKLKEAEDARVKLVNRAISREDEEELSWDVDDDEEEEEVDERNAASNTSLKKEDDVRMKEKDEIVEKKALNLESKGDFSVNNEQVEKGKNAVEELRVESDGSDEEANLEKEDSVSKSAEKVASEGKGDNEESSKGNGKDSDFSVVSSHPSMPEEEDLGWDEIEDLSSIDDKKGAHGGGSPSSNRAELKKRLSTAEEEEDLSWDIEDDDEPVKA
ncbi:hypothetical protein PTKIN_Ptkin12aG0124900 [Pterospermum kingtungense]